MCCPKHAASLFTSAGVAHKPGKGEGTFLHLMMHCKISKVLCVSWPRENRACSSGAGAHQSFFETLQT